MPQAEEAFNQMAIPESKAARLNELSLYEETACWHLALDCAANALKRNFKGVSLLINDGPEARQTVSHAHIHVVALQKLPRNADLEAIYDGIRSERSFNFNLLRRHRLSVDFRGDGVRALRDLRQKIANDRSSSFGIYTRTPWNQGVSELAIELWDKSRPAPYSLKSMLMYHVGLRSRPENKQPGSFTHFEKL